jgi:anti-sigma-K factor RskA
MSADVSGDASPPGPPARPDLAAEYVLGSLSLDERRALQARLHDDPGLRAAVLEWEERLLPLADLAAPAPVSAHLWSRIERSVGEQEREKASEPPRRAAMPAPAQAAWRRWWDHLPLWRSVGTAGLAMAALLAAVLEQRINAPPPAPQFIVVLVAPQAKDPGWVIQARDALQVELIPLAVAQVPADRVLQFWTKADGWAGPVSLGLVQPGQSVRVPLDRLPPLQANQLFELTLEPSGGSTTGRPTGPVQAIGRAVKVL